MIKKHAWVVFRETAHIFRQSIEIYGYFGQSLNWAILRNYEIVNQISKNRRKFLIIGKEFFTNRMKPYTKLLKVTDPETILRD